MSFAGDLRDYGGGSKMVEGTVSRSVKARGVVPGPVSVIVRLWVSKLTFQGLDVPSCEMGTSKRSLHVLRVLQKLLEKMQARNLNPSLFSGHLP